MLGQADFPKTIAVDLEIAFSKGMGAVANNNWRQLVEIVPSTSNVKQEIFYGDDGRMRRWKDERQAIKFREYKMNITASPWEKTRAWKRSEVNRDQSGGVLIGKVQTFGETLAVDIEREFWEFMRNGSSIKGFDRAYLYDFNHIYTDSTGATVGKIQSNMHLGGSQLDATTLQLEQQHYAELEWDSGNKTNLALSHIAVYRGSVNHKLARELNNSSFTIEASTAKGQMTPNVFEGAFSIIDTVYGIGASEWISFALNNPELKPVKVLSETVNPGLDNPRFSTLGLDSESDASFQRNEVSVGYELNFDFNPGYWMTTRLHGSSSYSFTPADLENQRVLYPNQ